MIAIVRTDGRCYDTDQIYSGGDLWPYPISLCTDDIAKGELLWPKP